MEKYDKLIELFEEYREHFGLTNKSFQKWSHKINNVNLRISSVNSYVKLKVMILYQIPVESLNMTTVLCVIL